MREVVCQSDCTCTMSSELTASYDLISIYSDHTHILTHIPSHTPTLLHTPQLKQLMPKAPTTAYFLFCKAKRGKLQKKHPELSPIEVTAKLGRKWKSMGEEGKVRHPPTRFKRFNIALNHSPCDNFTIRCQLDTIPG